jgi:glycosyltransferase involved in cell wall biosynthesis
MATIPVNLNGSVPEPPARPTIDVSVVTGTLNRLRLLKSCIESVRLNGFSGKIEIVAVDGGSTDGTLKWLAKQRDISTIVQPNYKIEIPGLRPRLAHSWGEFMNIGFRACQGKWVLMISDDLILSLGCIQKGFDMLERLIAQGHPVGAGALFYRDYPRELRYHVKLLPRSVVLVNHGFFLREALGNIQYIDEHSYEFYAADGDLCMRLAGVGYEIAPLDGCLADHLAHLPDFRRLFGKAKPKAVADYAAFEQRWGEPASAGSRVYSDCQPTDQSYRKLWQLAPIQCALSASIHCYSKFSQLA